MSADYSKGAVLQVRGDGRRFTINDFIDDDLWLEGGGDGFWISRHAADVLLEPALLYIDDDEFNEDEWASVTPAPGEVWRLDTNGLVTILALASPGEWACGPYGGHGVDPEWTSTHTRGQLRYRASAG